MSNETNAAFVSRVIGGLNSLTKDDHISRRYVLGIGRGKARTYISQKLKDNTLFREMNIYSSITCLELKKIDAVKCPAVEFRKCGVLMRSKKKLPELIFSSLGASILSANSIDGEHEIDLKSISEYRTSKNRMFKLGTVVCYVHNGYLYIPDFEIEAINIDILTLDKKEANDSCGCDNDDVCKSVWEYPFVCPDKLYEPIINETIAEVLRKKSIPADENPNLDNNQKSQTVV